MPLSEARYFQLERGRATPHRALRSERGPATREHGSGSALRAWHGVPRPEALLAESDGIRRRARVQSLGADARIAPCKGIHDQRCRHAKDARRASITSGPGPRALSLRTFSSHRHRAPRKLWPQGPSSCCVVPSRATRLRILFWGLRSQRLLGKHLGKKRHHSLHRRDASQVAVHRQPDLASDRPGLYGHPRQPPIRIP